MAPDPDYCANGVPHDWERTEEFTHVGLVCANCGLSEAELAGEDPGE